MEATEKKSRGRPLAFDRDQARDIALKLFWSQGYEGASISDLTNAIGINRPSLYASFGNKENLFKICTESYLAEELSFIDEAMKEKSFSDALEKLFEHEIKLIADNKGCLLINTALTCHPENDAIKNLLAEHRKTLEGKIRKRTQQAQLKKEVATSESPNAIAKLMMSLYQGLSVQATDGASSKELQEVVKIALTPFKRA
jgi:AcrR family transcriptional regulator